MKKSLFIIGFCVLFALQSCNNASVKKKTDTIITNSAKSEAIPYSVAQNYFVKNTYKNTEIQALKITSQQDFDTYFGAATTMSENGKATPINWEKSNVIAVIVPETNLSTVLSAVNLSQKNKTIVLNYQITEGAKQTFTTKPILLLVIDKKWNGEVILEK